MANEEILVVDHDTTVLMLLQMILKSVAYDVVVAVNGEGALAVRDREEPELILSEIMMPGIDGVEYRWMIRENSENSYVPFIFLTSRRESETELHGFRIGANDYIRKPFERKNLRHSSGY